MSSCSFKILVALTFPNCVRWLRLSGSSLEQDTCTLQIGPCRCQFYPGSSKGGLRRGMRLQGWSWPSTLTDRCTEHTQAPGRASTIPLGLSPRPVLHRGLGCKARGLGCSPCVQCSSDHTGRWPNMWVGRRRSPTVEHSSWTGASHPLWVYARPCSAM